MLARRLFEQQTRRAMLVSGALKRTFTTTAVKRNQMSWADFFKHRTRRRRLGLACSIASSAIFTVTGFAYVGNLEIDATEKTFGLDSVIVYAFSIAFVGVVGWQVGPSLGNLVHRGLLGKKLPDFVQRDTTFLKHILRNRPDPTKQSTSNPPTDYYGEKISSLSGYRQWLRDSHAFVRKSQKFL